MDKAAEYRLRAEECRLLARSDKGEQHDQFLNMAAQWEALARQREELLERGQEVSGGEPPSEGDPTAG